jgi:hypothetical protein
VTVEQSKIIDAVGVEGATGDVVLMIADHLDWDDEQQHLRTLQEKLNSCLAFIESDELLETSPKAAGRRARIDVVFRVPPSDGALGFLKNALKTIESAKIGFGWRTFSDAT